eukprot:1158497-Pelagomonas_calceolata.AAC.1
MQQGLKLCGDPPCSCPCRGSPGSSPLNLAPLPDPPSRPLSLHSPRGLACCPKFGVSLRTC